jgi:ubiquinone/menaquinone biosynthesis C-methylase UbiE
MIPKEYKETIAKKGKNMWLNRKSDVEKLMGFLKQHFPKLEGLQLLDAGCAQGRDSAEIASHSIKVTGIDVNKEFIEEAKKTHPNMDFLVGKIEELPFKDNQFDVVYCVNTLFYLKPETSLPELGRVLRKGGVMFITLDKEIVDLDKNTPFHTLNVEETLKILKDYTIISKEYKEREDSIPFRHRHFFYEIVAIKK